MFKKASKKQSRCRAAIMGPSGSGKTLSALLIARGLAGPDGAVAVIDTERGSACKYSGLVDFDVLELDSYSVEKYIAAILAADEAGYSVLVIDSLSHAWAGKDGVLEFVDDEARRSKSGNSFTAWRNATPKHNMLVDTIISSPLHIICTMRVKTEYVIEEINGKKVPRKLGKQPVQREGLEYEFDIVGDIDHEHVLVVTKSRCIELADAVIPRPGVQLGEQLLAWLSDGVDPEEEKRKTVLRKEFSKFCKRNPTYNGKALEELAAQEGYPAPKDCTADQLQGLMDILVVAEPKASTDSTTKGDSKDGESSTETNTAS